MAVDESVKIVITAEDKASGVFTDVGKNAGSLAGSLSSLAKVAGVAMVAGFGALVAGGISSARAFAESERASRQLNHAILDVSKGTKEQVEQVKELTMALQRKAGIDGDALTMGVAQLSTFGLQTKSVVALTKSLADFTVNQNGLTASSDQYVQSANTIAKALNGQFGILEKSGIRFTEAQQQLILFGSESEKVAALTEGLNQNLRETTDTVAPSFEAKLAVINQSFGELQEAIGSALVEAIMPFITQLSDWAAQPETQEKIKAIVTELANFVKQMAPIIQQVLPAFIGLVKISATVIGTMWGAFIKVGEAIGTGIFLIGQFIDKVKQLVDWVVNLIDRLKELARQLSQGVIGAATKTIGAVSNAGSAVGNVFSGGAKMLGFAEGGIVPGPIGAPVPALVHGGETIIPPGGRMGGSNINIYISGNSILNEDMVEKIGDTLISRLKQNMRI